MDEHTLDAAVVAAAEAAAAAVAAEEVEDDQVFTIEMMDVGGQGLRVGRTTGNGLHPPLLMFNGIGGNIELLAPLAHALAEREVITFDIPGVGRIHTHWRISTTADQRILHIEVQSQGLGTLAAARSRADFTVFRACTNSDPTTGGCPEAP